MIKTNIFIFCKQKTVSIEDFKSTLLRIKSVFSFTNFLRITLFYYKGKNLKKLFLYIKYVKKNIIFNDLHNFMNYCTLKVCKVSGCSAVW
jgi:hypothetical protein